MLLKKKKLSADLNNYSKHNVVALQITTERA